MFASKTQFSDKLHRSPELSGGFSDAMHTSDPDMRRSRAVVITRLHVSHALALELCFPLASKEGSGITPDVTATFSVMKFPREDRTRRLFALSARAIDVHEQRVFLRQRTR